MADLRFRTDSQDATEVLGAWLAGLLQPDDIVSLDGDLGAGKTVFTKGVAKGLGITGLVSSPTFMLVMEHGNQSGLNLYHFDAYRLSGGEDFLAAGLDEYFDMGGICVIEWGKILTDILAYYPEKVFIVEIARVSDTQREIYIKIPSSRAQTAANKSALEAIQRKGVEVIV